MHINFMRDAKFWRMKLSGETHHWQTRHDQKILRELNNTQNDFKVGMIYKVFVRVQLH